jgi:hypothetical protein
MGTRPGWDWWKLRVTSASHEGRLQQEERSAFCGRVRDNARMTPQKESLFGQLVFRTADGKGALVFVYRGSSTFRLSRMSEGVMEDRSNIDTHSGDVSGYISEARLEWGDLIDASVEWKPSR